ncbi:MAG: response regulator transcription factor [Vicinamibacteria bacterium]|nr:response regulator transcription factor [Vicinamibacteria bacterium]MBP9944877.1 response regulator transcription factor [Vicinamibacteria bacterium]
MRVLIVEDDLRLAGVLRQGLREQGYAVDVASDGTQGFDMATTYEYDAILLDVMLPGRSGLDVLRDLRARGSRSPILVLSARSAVGERIRGLDLGADDYLSKPFEFQELLARLRAITRRPAVEPRTTLKAGDLEMDVARREASRGGRPLDLTTKEFALLEYFLRRKGLLLTRSMILDHVWDADYDGGSNLVEVYVNYLRRKTERNDAPRLIHTVRGAGYVLKEAE